MEERPHGLGQLLESPQKPGTLVLQQLWDQVIPEELEEVLLGGEPELVEEVLDGK